MGKDDVFISRWIDNAYAIPVALDSAINTDGYEFNAFVSPDESFLLFSGYNRPDGMGSGDLYISQNKNGAWGKAINMGGNVNSRWMDYCPFVHGDTLYFTSKRSLTFTSGQAITNLDDFNKIVQSYENGLSRIYKIHIGTYIRE